LRCGLNPFQKNDIIFAEKWSVVPTKEDGSAKYTMKAIVCSNCGASSWKESFDSRTCVYCGTRYALVFDDYGDKGAGISVNSDVQNLLRKCRLEPAKARKYANLILDIDPTNEEALKYL